MSGEYICMYKRREFYIVFKILVMICRKRGKPMRQRHKLDYVVTFSFILLSIVLKQ